MRSATSSVLFVVGAIVLAGCDTLNMRYISVPDTVQSTKSGATLESVVGEIESILVEREFRRQSRGEWYWRGEEGPGLVVDIRHEDDSLTVEIVQGLFGPIGPTKEFKSLLEEIRNLLIREFGDQVVIRKGP